MAMVLMSDRMISQKTEMSNEPGPGAYDLVRQPREHQNSAPVHSSTEKLKPFRQPTQVGPGHYEIKRTPVTEKVLELSSR